MPDWNEVEERMREIFAEQERQQQQEGVEISSRDITQLFEKIMTPKEDYGVITKDLKTSNLDKTNINKVIFMKSVAKDFVIFRDTFGLQKDIWVNATLKSIDADAEIMAAASQGFLAKLLETFVTLKRESRITSELKKEKRGLIFK